MARGHRWDRRATMRPWLLACGLVLLASLLTSSTAFAQPEPPPTPTCKKEDNHVGCDIPSQDDPNQDLQPLTEWGDGQAAAANSQAENQTEDARSGADATSDESGETATNASAAGSDQAESEKEAAERAIEEESGSDPGLALPVEPGLPGELPPVRPDEPKLPALEGVFFGFLIEPALGPECGEAVSESHGGPDAHTILSPKPFNPAHGNPVANCEPRTSTIAATWHEPFPPHVYASSASRDVHPWVAIGILGLTLAGLLAYLLWPLYARLPSDQVALHPRRAALVEAIRNQPGVHRRELLRQFPMGHGALEHHLRKLVGAGVLAESHGSRYTCYFIREGTDRRALGAAPFLKADGARRVLAVIAAKPHSAAEIASSTGLTVQAVRYHLTRLHRAELVRRQHSMAAWAYAVTESASALLRGQTSLSNGELAAAPSPE